MNKYNKNKIKFGFVIIAISLVMFWQGQEKSFKDGAVKTDGFSKKKIQDSKLVKTGDMSNETKLEELRIGELRKTQPAKEAAIQALKAQGFETVNIIEHSNGLYDVEAVGKKYTSEKFQEEMDLEWEMNQVDIIKAINHGRDLELTNDDYAAIDEWRYQLEYQKVEDF